MADWKPTRARISAENAIAEQRIFGNMQNVAAMGGEVDAPTPSAPTAKSGKTVAPNPQQPTKIPQSGYNPKTAVDEDYQKIQSGNAIPLDDSFKIADGDTFYYGKQGFRVPNIDAPDMDYSTKTETPEYRKAKQFAIDWKNNDKKKYLVPTGETDKYGRELSLPLAINSNGTLEKFDSLAIANNVAGPYAFHQGQKDRVLEMKTPRMSMIQSMYPQANKITTDNVPIQDKNRAFRKSKGK